MSYIFIIEQAVEHISALVVSLTCTLGSWIVSNESSSNHSHCPFNIHRHKSATQQALPRRTKAWPIKIILLAQPLSKFNNPVEAYKNFFFHCGLEIDPQLAFGVHMYVGNGGKFYHHLPVDTEK